MDFQGSVARARDLELVAEDHDVDRAEAGRDVTVGAPSYGCAASWWTVTRRAALRPGGVALLAPSAPSEPRVDLRQVRLDLGVRGEHRVVEIQVREGKARHGHGERVVRALLDEAVSRYGAVELVAVSCIADGPATWVAEAVLKREAAWK